MPLVPSDAEQPKKRAARAVRSAAAKKFVVARADDIKDGERLVVDILGRSIGIFNVENRYYAILNRCPHGGAELCKGTIVGLLESERPGEIRLDNSKKFLVCPWHGWEYELATGQSWFDPARTRARMFEVGVTPGEMVSSEIGSGAAAVAEDASAQFIDAATHRVKGPYTAEVLPVEVEDDYIVVSLRPPTSAPQPARANEGRR